MRPLEAADIPATATMLAAALDDDPAYRFLFPRADGLKDFFARNLRTHLPYRCTRVALDGFEVDEVQVLSMARTAPYRVWSMRRPAHAPRAGVT